ncbi:hypothetical protein [Brevundimonas sp.]|uniref:hypothetical protein n=1 Tax=Brevundimonas sp. TaxID=1871086 RepID=UPI002FCC7E14
MQPSKNASGLLRIFGALLVFWVVSLVFAVLAFISLALLIGHTYGDLSPRADLMFWGLSLLLLLGYSASLFFGIRFVLKALWPR